MRDGKDKYFKNTGLAFLTVVFIQFAINVMVYAQQTDKKGPSKQIILKNAANNSLWRLIRSIKNDGYYSSRVALNIWRSNAIDAGTFDQEKYDEFKKQIYEKSIDNSLRCFESAILNEFYNDATICLNTWNLHSKVLGIFEETQYNDMKKRLKSIEPAKKMKTD